MAPENTDLEKKEILRFLQRIGVDTRFVSVVLPHLYINNLRFSKFSRKREEMVQKNYPEIKVVRSTVFQKMCARSSKILGDSLQPREKVLINQGDQPWDTALSVILEPYSRKYGIKILKNKLDLSSMDSKINPDLNTEFDAIALPLTLDHEVESVLGKIFTGEQISLQSSQHEKGDVKLIYPLINVPLEWICSWLGLDNNQCQIKRDDELPHEFLLFLEGVVPQVRENILKASLYLVNEK